MARLSKGESVATAKATRENPGMVTAMNKGKVDEYFEKEYLPKYLVSHDVESFAENTVNSLLLQEFIAVKGEMKEIRKELKQRPVSQVNMNNLGEVIDTKIVNGLKKAFSELIKFSTNACILIYIVYRNDRVHKYSIAFGY